jgi:hypothetical protein
MAQLQQKRMSIYDTEEGQELLEELLAMEQDSKYRTDPQFCVDSEKYPDNLMPFIHAHMSYMHKNPRIDKKGYLSNLRLMLTIR